MINERTTDISLSPAQSWAYETIQKVKEALDERQGHVEKKTMVELAGIYSDILLMEIEKLRKNIHLQFYGDGTNLTVKDLITDICNMYNVTFDAFETKSRKREYIEPQQLFHWCMRNKVVRNTLTLEQIGALTAGKDHTTVLHSCKNVKNRIATERKFREDIMKLCNRFGNKAMWNGNEIELTRIL